MKQKISISIGEESIKFVEEYIKKGIFRNKSHAIEQGLSLLIKNAEASNHDI